MGYAEKLAAEGKAILIAYDFETVSTRFVNHLTDDMTLPSGYTLFEGAVAGRDSGSRIDLPTGRLTIGEASVGFPLSAELVSWLQSNDGELNGCVVVRREGFRGVPEGQWVTTRWLVSDYKIGRTGLLEFELTNPLTKMQRGLYEEFDGESYELDDAVHTTGLLTSDTTITLQKSPKGIWREPGYVCAVDPDTDWHELIAYETIGGTGDLELQTLTRETFGVGDPGRDFPASVRLFHVWAKRSDPIQAILEWLLTPEGAGSGAVREANFGQLLQNSNLNDWPLDGAADNWEIIDGGGSFGEATEETAIVREGSAVRLTSSTTAFPRIRQSGAGGNPVTGLEASKLYMVAFDCILTGPCVVNTAQNVWRVIVENETAANGHPQAFNVNPTVWSSTEQVFTGTLEANVWTRVELWFTTDAGMSASDDWRFHFQFGTSSGSVDDGASGVFDRVQLWGPWDATAGREPLNLYDGGDGDGLGMPFDDVDVAAFEELRDEFYALPTFDGSGDKTSGTATLFLDRRPIEDVKRWIEDLMRAYALIPTTTVDERFSGEIYFRVPPVETAIGDRWRKGDFRPSQWSRNFASRVNNLRLQTDHTIERRPALDRPYTQSSSVDRFGISKPFEVKNYGGRTGINGFPDYESMTDLEDAARRVLLDVANPGSDFDVRVFYQYRNVALGQIVRMNVPQVVNLSQGQIGLEEAQLLVTRRRIDNERGYVDLQVRERRPVVRPAFVGPPSMASDYSTASAADKQFCYLTDDSETEFADGSDGYTVT